MLRSVRVVFETIGIKPESMKFIKERFDSSNLVKALTKQPKKCPAIVTCDMTGHISPHVMVATNALKGKEFIAGNGQIVEALRKLRIHYEWFVNCKNSYRDDISEPGTV